ncbi:hypothetical protein NDU88_004523 [Pleurodeles waltl]|uniref:Uncharacterized protein n=1 Tax=Pleurodeles waltl TaxID=8319 RepID=A0AAV7LLZ5_PLEWA|nr:hypothetical protein NDU88_004523 [Pleurodeles waltl]
MRDKFQTRRGREEEQKGRRQESDEERDGDEERGKGSEEERERDEEEKRGQSNAEPGEWLLPSWGEEDEAAADGGLKAPVALGGGILNPESRHTSGEAWHIQVPPY